MNPPKPSRIDQDGDFICVVSTALSRRVSGTREGFAEALGAAWDEIALLKSAITIQALEAPSSTALQNRLKRRDAGQNRTRKLKKQLFVLLQCGSNGRIIEEVTRLLADNVQLENAVAAVQKAIPELLEYADLMPGGMQRTAFETLLSHLGILMNRQNDQRYNRRFIQMANEVPYLRETGGVLRQIIKRLVGLCRHVGPPKPDHVCGAEGNCDMSCAAYAAWEEILCECEDAAKVVPFDQRPKKEES